MSLNALVVVVRVVVAGVRCSWSLASTFRCYPWLPSCQLLHRWGMETIFKNLCYNNTDQVCFAKTVSSAPVRIQWSHHPGARRRLVSGFRDSGSVLILGQVTQYGNPYLTCVTKYNDTWLPKVGRMRIDDWHDVKDLQGCKSIYLDYLALRFDHDWYIHLVFVWIASKALHRTEYLNLSCLGAARGLSSKYYCICQTDSCYFM